MSSIGTGRVASPLAVLVRTVLVAATATFVSDRLRSSRAALVSTELSPAGALTLLAGHVTLTVLAMLAALLAFAIAHAAARLVPRPRWVAHVVVVAAVWIGIAAWPLLRAGAELAAGAWVSEQSWAALVGIAPLSLWIAAAPVVAAIAFDPPTTRRRRVLVTVVLTLVAIGLELADDIVQPGQYPELHMLAHAAVVVCALLLAQRVVAVVGASGRMVTALALAVCLWAPVLWLSMNGAIRGELLLRSSVAEHWIRHATPHRRQDVLRSQLAELDPNLGRYVPADQLDTARGLIDARDMNVVMVVVDTMRADTLAPARGEGNAWADAGDTPFIDRWLAGSYHFTRNYAAATNTGRSTPTLMRSIQSFDDPYDGVPIGPRMQALGYTAVAVVLDFFISGKQKAAGSLLEGFEDVQVFERKQTGDAVPTALAQIERVRERPFLAWVHMYPLHEPGFDGELLSRADGSRIERYRRSLRWLDGQLRELVEGLGAMGLADHTIVVLAADHGEGLGQHGKWQHGSLIYDEVLHVPLAFSIPGQPGGELDTLVGNIDMVPTLMDLLGAGTEPTDRGHSLVPLMVGHGEPTPRSYYAETAKASFSSVVRGWDKLIYDVDSDVFHRYDLRADPDETVDLFDPSGGLDRELVRELAALKPELFAAELDDEEVEQLLADRLSELDPEAPGAALPFLVRLVAARPKPALVEAVVALAERSSDRGLRLLVLRYLWPHARGRLETMLSQWITDSRTDELEIVTSLAAQGQSSFATKAVLKRMKHFAERGQSEQWEPYLRLVAKWPRRLRDHGPMLVSMLARSDGGGTDPRVVALVLDSVAGLGGAGSRKGEQELVTELASAVRPFAQHLDPRVRASALRALAELGDESSRELMRWRLLDLAEDVRVRRAAVEATAELGGPAASEALVLAGADPRLTASVIVELADAGSAEAIPFLSTIARKHHNPYTRKDAKKAIDRIESRGAD